MTFSPVIKQLYCYGLIVIALLVKVSSPWDIEDDSWIGETVLYNISPSPQTHLLLILHYTAVVLMIRIHAVIKKYDRFTFS